MVGLGPGVSGLDTGAVGVRSYGVVSAVCVKPVVSDGIAFSGQGIKSGIRIRSKAKDLQSRLAKWSGVLSSLAVGNHYY